MFLKLFLIFTLVPLIELSLLVKIGSYIGTLNTIMLVIVTAVVGAYLVRLEGAGVMSRMQKNMREGTFPAEEVIDGAMILIAGALLLTPGIITDALGFLALFPVSRTYIKKITMRQIRKKMNPDEIEIDIS